MYKIINTNSGNIQIMNREEKDIFFSHSKKQMSNWSKYGKRNMYGDYDVQPIRPIDSIPTWVIITGLAILTVASILLHIQFNY
tara:strand:+ start:1297 stop:1545 length:249 start_codon:yes stop_codon:yes gene_type:complete